jgi:hypothetical protein
MEANMRKRTVSPAPLLHVFLHELLHVSSSVLSLALVTLPAIAGEAFTLSSSDLAPESSAAMVGFNLNAHKIAAAQIEVLYAR